MLGEKNYLASEVATLFVRAAKPVSRMATALKRYFADGSSGATLSVSQKVYVRSRRGKATKIVQEHYLRTDIPCSSQLCPICSLNLPKDSSGAGKRDI